MHNEIISLSHNDLDRCGCELILHWKFGNNITYFNTNYRDIHEQFLNMEEEIHKNPPRLITITDVSMAEYRDDLIALAQHGVPVIFLDHHMYPDGYFDDLPSNIKWVHDVNRCGAKITADFFQCNEPHLRALIEIINVYDIWLEENSQFKVAMDLNNYYREVGHEYMFNEIINNGYKLPSNYSRVVQEVNDRNNKKLQSLHNKNLIYSANGITVAFTDDLVDEITFSEAERGNKICLICTSYGHIRVRFRHDVLSREKKLIIRERLSCSKIGHLDAFPVVIKNSNFNKIIDKVKEITEIILEVK